jgi:hypothetical protein
MKNIFVRIIGPEYPQETTTLRDCRGNILNSYGNLVASEDEIHLLVSDSTIYLIGHGDNPEKVKNPKFGDNSPEQVANIIIEILKSFCDPNNGKRFNGLIILEGCHGAEVGRYSATSFKQQLKEILQNNKTFRALVEAEARIGGYLGLAFDAQDYKETTYGIASTENKYTKLFQNRSGSYGALQEDGSVIYQNENSFVESRVFQKSYPSPQLTRKAASQLKKQRTSTKSLQN